MKLPILSLRTTKYTRHITWTTNARSGCRFKFHAKKLGHYNEFEFLSQLEALTCSNTSGSPGDDCAILKKTDPPLLATTDLLTREIHYDDSYSPFELGVKLVDVNVSDIAAMGGKPTEALAGYTGSREPGEIEQLIASVNRRLTKHGAELVGGDTVQSHKPRGETIYLTLLGQASGDGLMTRDAGTPGDLIAVSGQLGATSTLLETDFQDRPELRRHLYEYDPPLSTGEKLTEVGCKCAIDVSDGLIRDLERICHASGTGAVINWKKVPVHPVALEHSDSKEEALKSALGGGEDYVLLACFPETIREQVEKLDLQIIGKLKQEEGIVFEPELPFEASGNWQGYDHFEL